MKKISLIILLFLFLTSCISKEEKEFLFNKKIECNKIAKENSPRPSSEYQEKINMSNYNEQYFYSPSKNSCLIGIYYTKFVNIKKHYYTIYDALGEEFIENFSLEVNEITEEQFKNKYNSRIDILKN